MSDVVVKIQKSGPYLISGPLRVVDYQGKEYAVAGQKTVALCRCGHSKSRPFCDGTHKTCGFSSEETAI